MLRRQQQRSAAQSCQLVPNVLWEEGEGEGQVLLWQLTVVVAVRWGGGGIRGQTVSEAWESDSCRQSRRITNEKFLMMLHEVA